MEGAKSEWLEQRRRQAYNAKIKEVKQSAGEDKRNWMEEMAEEAEKGIENGRNKALYNITKTIANEQKRQEGGMKDKQGVLKRQKEKGCREGYRYILIKWETKQRDPVESGAVEEDGEEELDDWGNRS